MKQEIKRTMVVALPIILGNMTQMVLGIIDAAMIGAIDYVQLAASSLVINVLGIPYVVAIGMTMAISPLVAIANGRNDTWSASHYLANGVVLCTLIGVGIAVLIDAGSGILNHLGQDPEVVAASGAYLRIMAWSTIPMVFFLSLKHFTDALEHVKVAMTLSLLALPLNVFLNWLLIYGNWGFPRLEIEGAGWATIATRIAMSVALLGYILKSATFKAYISERTTAWRIQRSSIMDLLRIGIPSSIQYGLEVGAFAVSGIIIGWFGAQQQAAHQIALNCAALTFMVALGLSQAGSIRVSNALGRNDWSQLRKIGFSTLLFGLILSAVFAVMFVIFHPWLPYIFNQDAEVVAIAATLLLFAALFQLSDATQAIGVGILRGVKDVRIPTLFVAIAYWVVGLPVGLALGILLKMEAIGIWIGFVTGLTLSSLLLNYRFATIVKRYVK
jgi:multidrug resistance protein, MATE family